MVAELKAVLNKTRSQNLPAMSYHISGFKHHAAIIVLGHVRRMGIGYVVDSVLLSERNCCESRAIHLTTNQD